MKRLVPLTPAIRKQIKRVRQAMALFPGGEHGYLAQEIEKVELAEQVLKAVARAERLAQLPRAAAARVLELKAKRRRQA